MQTKTPKPEALLVARAVLLSFACVVNTVRSSALEEVARFSGPMPTDVTVSHEGRIFVNFPRWRDQVSMTVAEVRQGEAVAYPNEAVNRPDASRSAQTFISVQSVVVDARNRLWVLG